MVLAAAVSFMLAQATAPPTAAPPQPPVNCLAPLDAAVMAYCAGEEALTQGTRQDAPGAARNDARFRAVAAFRRAADLARDPAVKKRALEQLEQLYGEEHLNLPREADPVLRELMAMSHDDLAPMFRLAKMQERQGLFDAAESTLLAARQQKPDEVAPYKELAQYFARRVAAMTAAEKEQKKQDADTPDGDGVYSLGGSVQAPEKISMESVALPVEVAAGGLSGSVTIMAVVDALGRVSDAKILHSVRGLDDTALAAVKQWRFAPAMLNGQPVPVRMPIVVRVGGGAT